MNNVNYIFDLIEKSDVTLIGYTYRVENIKDEIISKLPCYRLGEISSSFSFKAHLRDIKINQILGYDDYFKYIILDISDIRLDGYKLNPMSRGKLIESIISNIREDMSPYKLIITTPLYKSSSDDDKNFIGGSRPLYMADFAFVIQEPKLLVKSNIKVIKNRHDIERNNISIEGLKEYKYNEISYK